MGAWTFDLSQYGSVWNTVINIGVLLAALLIGNLLRRVIPFLRKAFIPSALIGGFLVFVINIAVKEIFGVEIVDRRIMQVVTYHALAIGFIAMSMKIVEKKKDGRGLFVVQNGLLTGGTYMLQAVVGILVSLVFFWIGGTLFYDTGVLLPLGFGQGPGNALTWDVIFTADGHLTSNGSLGLTIASIGFVVASVVGVIYINIYKRKGEIVKKEKTLLRSVSDFETDNEIEDSESVDKSSIQFAFVAVSYLLAFLIMFFFKKLSDWTGVKLFNDVAWGFNFIWGVITATLLKAFMKFLKKKNVVKKKYINNYQMDRISGFAFDLMIIAGVAAIDVQVVTDYIFVILALCLAGTVATVIYVKIMTKLCFKGFCHESFLVNFGTLTGTASNGMILLREIDPDYATPTSNIFILSQFPAMIAVAPLLLLLNMGAGSYGGCLISLGIFSALFIGYTLFLVLSSRKRAKKEAENDLPPLDKN